MTYYEAKMQGYRDGHCAWQRGYVSRRCDVDAQQVHVGRYGLYVLLPSWDSTQYCIRQYLTK